MSGLKKRPEEKELTLKKEATEVLKEIVYPVVKKAVIESLLKGHPALFEGAYLGIFRWITLYIYVKPEIDIPKRQKKMWNLWYRTAVRSELAFWYRKAGKIEVRQVIKPMTQEIKSKRTKQPEPIRTSLTRHYSKLSEEWVSKKVAEFVESVLKAY